METSLTPSFRFATSITVGPIGPGWLVSSDIEENLVFLSGARAEAEARRLGKCLAAVGENAVIEIHDRQHLLVGRIRFNAQEAWL